MKNVAFSDEMSIRLEPHKNRRNQGIHEHQNGQFLEFLKKN